MQINKTRESQILECVEKYRLLFLEEYSKGRFFLRTQENYQATVSMIMASHWLNMHSNMVDVLMEKTKVYHGISGMAKAMKMVAQIDRDCGPGQAEILRKNMYQEMLVLSDQ